MNKTKKITTFIILLITLLSSMSITSLATTQKDNDTSEYIKLNAGTLEDQIQNEKNRNKALLEFRSLVKPFSTGSRTLNINTYEQEKYYWCGPASIKEVIQFINGSSASQSTYASSMGTNSEDGSYVYKMANELNKRQSKFTYSYETGIKDEDTLGMDIVLSTDFGKPCIFHANTKYLYMYNGHNTGHYLVCRGYSFSGFQTASLNNNTTNSQPLSGTVYYVDSNYQNYGRGKVLGNQSDSLTNIYNCLKGRYIIL